MKRSNRKRHRPEEVVVKLRQADEALAEGTPIAEVARSPGVPKVTLHRWRGPPPDSWTPLTGRIAPVRRSVFHVHDASVCVNSVSLPSASCCRRA